MRTRVPAALAVSLLGVLPAAGCYQGFEGTVNSQGPTGNGRDFAVGSLMMQNTTLVADASGSGAAALTMTVVNDGDTDDTLVSVSAEGVGEGDISGPILVPAEGAVAVGGPGDGPVVEFTGLTQPSGTYVEVTLEFRDGGSVTEPIGIVPGTGYYEDYAPTGAAAEADEAAEADDAADEAEPESAEDPDAESDEAEADTE